jgi:hypothetical protein
MDESDTTDEEPKRRDNIVAIWERAVQTQMHFNEMSVKSRQLGLTFVAAALGVAIFLFTRTDGQYSLTKTICGVQVTFHVAVLIVLAAAMAVWAVRILDLKVYHRMLRGAVTFGEDLEEKQIRRILGLEKGMTQAISHFSRHSDAKVERTGSESYKYTGKNRKNAEQKIAGFYYLVVGALIFAAIALFWLTNKF